MLNIVLNSNNHNILVSFLGFDIYTYGVIIAFAVFLGISAVYFAVKYFLKSITLTDISNLAPVILFCGIIGARLYYCLLNFDFYISHPLEIFAIRHGGISIHGAILGGLLTLMVYSKVKKISLLSLCDAFVIGLPLAQSVGRWGNFFNSEAFGLPIKSDFPLKLYIAPQYRPEPFFNYEYFHPAFLYESMADLIVFLIMIILLLKKPKKGMLTATYLILYSVVRLLTEQIRLDSALDICGIPVAQIVSAIMLLCGFLILILNLRCKP